MSADEVVYALLTAPERAMWTRAASVAQDERRTPVEIALALDVTALLSRNALVRHVMAGPVVPSICPLPSEGTEP